jgi:hypothetical protein
LLSCINFSIGDRKYNLKEAVQILGMPNRDGIYIVRKAAHMLKISTVSAEVYLKLAE